MTQAKKGNKVKVHYSGSLNDGKEFDSSFGKEPFEFTLGEGKVIRGFENAVVGMTVGETKTISISPTEAYGEYQKDLLVEVERSHLPPEIKPRAGQMLQFRSEDGTMALVTVKDIMEETVVLDGNHPLAGEELVFKIELLEIV